MGKAKTIGAVQVVVRADSKELGKDLSKATKKLTDWKATAVKAIVGVGAAAAAGFALALRRGLKDLNEFEKRAKQIQELSKNMTAQNQKLVAELQKQQNASAAFMGIDASNRDFAGQVNDLADAWENVQTAAGGAAVKIAQAAAQMAGFSSAASATNRFAQNVADTPAALRRLWENVASPFHAGYRRDVENRRQAELNRNRTRNLTIEDRLAQHGDDMGGARRMMERLQQRGLISEDEYQRGMAEIGRTQTRMSRMELEGARNPARSNNLFADPRDMGAVRAGQAQADAMAAARRSAAEAFRNANPRPTTAMPQQAGVFTGMRTGSRQSLLAEQAGRRERERIIQMAKREEEQRQWEKDLLEVQDKAAKDIKAQADATKMLTDMIRIAD